MRQNRRRMSDLRDFQDYAWIGVDWFWETDAQDRFTYFSPATPQAGFDADSNIGARRGDGAVQEPDNLARLAELEAKIARREPFHEFVYLARFASDSAPRGRSISGGPCYDADGTFLGYRGVGRDVTAEVAARRALEAQSQTLKAILRAMPDGVEVIDKPGTSRISNDQFYEILGVPHLQGRPDAAMDGLREMAARGEYGPGDPATLARERFEAITRKVDAEGSVVYQRQLQTGRWIEGRVLPLDERGYLSLYRDITEAKQHEAELARQATLLQSIFTHFPGGISVFDENERLVAWNERYADIIGADPAVVRVGATPREILISVAKAGELGPYDPVAAADRRLGFFRSGRMDFIELERRNGRAFEMRRASLPGGGTVSIYFDITERRQAVRALEALNATLEGRVAERTGELVENQRFLSSLLASVPGVVYRRRLGSAGTVEFASEGTWALLGIAPESLVDGTVHYDELIHPEDRERVSRKVHDDLSAGDLFNDEYRVRHADGSWRWVHDRGRRLRIESTPGTRLEGLITDISARKEAVEALARARDHLADAADSISHGMTLYGRDGRLVLATSKWAEYYPDAEKIFVVGHTFEQVIRGIVDSGALELPPDEPEERFLAERVAHHKRADGVPFVRRLPNGRLLQMSDHPTRNGGVVTLGTDVTDQVEAERRREVEEERLRQSQKMEAVGHLTGGVAHDFNNILMVILANVDALLDEDDVIADPRPHLQRISGAANRAAQLTRQLLAFARKQTLVLKRTDLNELVMNTRTMLRRTLGEHIEIDAMLASDLWPTHTDRAQVEAALVNLCLNSRDAMPTGGRLLIETGNVTLDASRVADTPETAAGDYVMLSVTDTGTGMPPEVLARVFEPFFTTKEVGKGTGLGLSMVYGFVKQSKGHIEIDSAVGRGTVIRLHLPRSTRDETVRAPRPEVRMARGTERVLVVEDEEDVRVIVVEQLTSLGYTVAQAGNGPEGLRALRGAAFDLLLTDVVMPGAMDGKALATLAATLHPGLRVLFMSGYPEDAVSSTAIHDLGVNLLSKPFRKADLASAVRRALDGK